MNDDNVIYQIAVWLVPLVIAIVFHEIAHGLVARRLGDPTAEERGRLTLNPIKHVDPFGTVLLPMMLALTHAPVFGWAKPVPVNYRRLGKPRRDMILVALAGPGMNLLLALLGTIILAITVATTNSEPGQVAQFVAHNAINFVFINIFLAVFNLIPVPPFDGGHVVEGLMPRPAARRFRRIGRYSLLVLVFLLLILPSISDSADIVGQVVSPVVDSIAIFLMGVAGLRIS